MEKENCLELCGVFASIDDKVVLKNINLNINKGEVHAVIGESGSGKTILGQVLTGYRENNGGGFKYRNHFFSKIKNINPKPAFKIIPQNLQQTQNFLTSEYLFYNKYRSHRLGFSSRKRFIKMAGEIFNRFNLSIDPHQDIREIDQSDFSVLEFLNKSNPAPELLLLDELFSKIKSSHLTLIYKIIKDLKAEGVSIIFLTTKISYIYDIADRVSIIKNGEIIYSDKVDSIDKINLIRLTYTDPIRNINMEELNKSFYHFLKFNEAILQSLPANIIVSNRDNEIVMLNDYCKDHYKIGNNQYIRTPIKKFFEEENKAFLNILDGSLLSKEINTFYHIPMKIGGRSTSNNLKILPITEDEIVIGNIIIIEDVSELVTLQEKIILAQNLSSVGILAAGVAHEINNALEALHNFSNLLLFDRTEDDDKEIFEGISEEISYIDTIISNLISFSDYTSAKNCRTNIAESLNRIVKIISYNPQYIDINIDIINKSKQKIFSSINENEIKQVFLNLIRNSYDATEGKGDIVITLNNFISWVEIIYEDNGPGIPDENMSNIFLPFFSTKKERGSHLGLGLSIVHTIVTKNEGQITLGNKEGGGVITRITLPLTK